MIAVRSIRYGFPGFAGHASCQVEWNFPGECFACTMLVQWRKVNSPSWGAVSFPGDYCNVYACQVTGTRFNLNIDALFQQTCSRHLGNAANASTVNRLIQDA